MPRRRQHIGNKYLRVAQWRYRGIYQKRSTPVKRENYRKERVALSMAAIMTPSMALDIKQNDVETFEVI